MLLPMTAYRIGAEPIRDFAGQITNAGSTLPKIESTVRYLGIEVDDAIEIAEKIDI
jgi:hypothetical protein